MGNVIRDFEVRYSESLPLSYIVIQWFIWVWKSRIIFCICFIVLVVLVSFSLPLLMCFRSNNNPYSHHRILTSWCQIWTAWTPLHRPYRAIVLRESLHMTQIAQLLTKKWHHQRMMEIIRMVVLLSRIDGNGKSMGFSKTTHNTCSTFLWTFTLTWLVSGFSDMAPRWNTFAKNPVFIFLARISFWSTSSGGSAALKLANVSKACSIWSIRNTSPVSLSITWFFNDGSSTGSGCGNNGEGIDWGLDASTQHSRDGQKKLSLWWRWGNCWRYDNDDEDA